MRNKVPAAVNALVAAVMVLAAAVWITASVPAYSGHVQDWHNQPTPAQFSR